MYTIQWFKDIQAKRELCAYLSTTDNLKLTTHPAKFWLAAMTWFPKLLNITLTCVSECASQQHCCQAII